VARAAAVTEIATQAWALPAVMGDRRWVRAHARVSQGLLLVFEQDSAEKWKNLFQRSVLFLFCFAGWDE